MKKVERYIICMNFCDEQLYAISKALVNDFKIHDGKKHECMVGMYEKDDNFYVDIVVDSVLVETIGMLTGFEAQGLNELMLETINQKAEMLFKEDLTCGVKDADTLSAIISSVMESYFGQQNYAGIVKKAAAYWLKIATSQVFHNGNKRTALLSALLMLNINGMSLREINGNELYDISLNLANKKMTQDDLEQFILEKLVMNSFSTVEEATKNEWSFNMKLKIDNPNL